MRRRASSAFCRRYDNDADDGYGDADDGYGDADDGEEVRAGQMVLQTALIQCALQLSVLSTMSSALDMS